MNSQITSSDNSTNAHLNFASNVGEDFLKLINLFKTNPDAITTLLNIFPAGITSVCKNEHEISLLFGALVCYPKLLKETIDKIPEFVVKNGVENTNILSISSHVSESFNVLLNHDLFATEFVCKTNADGKTIIHHICNPSDVKNIEERVNSLGNLFESEKCPGQFILSHIKFFEECDERFKEVLKKSSKYVEPPTPEQIKLENDINELKLKLIEQGKMIEELMRVQADDLKMVIDLEKRLGDLRKPANPKV